MQSDMSTLERLNLPLPLDAIVDMIGDAVFVHDLDGHFIEVNRNACLSLGYSREELLTMNVLDVEMDFDLKKARKHWLEVQPGHPIHLRGIQKRKDGSRFPVEARLVCIVSPEQRLIFGLVRDITEQTEEERNFLQLLESTPEAIFVQTLGTIAYVNNAAIKLFKASKAEDLVGTPVLERILPENRETIKQRMFVLNSERKAITSPFEQEMICLDNSRVWVETSGEPYIYNGQASALVFVRDISQRKSSEQAMLESEARYRNLFEMAPIGIAVHARGKIVFANPTACHLIGAQSLEDLIGKPITDIIHPDNLRTSSLRIQRLLNGEEGLYPVEDVYLRLDGTALNVEVIATLLTFGKEPAVQVIIQDITQRKRHEEQLMYMSYHDHLTGLYNRRYFEKSLVQLDREENFPLSVIMADLNGLKLINDSFGHSIGDEMIRVAADTMKIVTKDSTILARVGGDEFILANPNMDINETRRLIKQLREKFSESQKELPLISMSFGFALKSDSEVSISKVIADAENDMYKEKLYESASMHSKAVDTILNTLFEKSEREHEHSKRVGEIAALIAHTCGLSTEEINRLRTSGFVHDIGKIGIRESILNKNGRLSEDEYTEIKEHPRIGWRILSSVSEFSELSQCILYHHEHWDGKGYPEGLKGLAIPLESRIIAVADALDAMTNDRTYRKGMNHSDALKEIRRCSGTQFDPKIVDAILMMDDVEAIFR